jgi:hypothetical protein
MKGYPAVTAPRFDIYAPIHKAFRMLMTETLVAVGRVDEHDLPQVEQTLGQVGRLLAFCRMHVEDENRFVHSAILARRPAGALQTQQDHEHHLADIAALEALAAETGAATGPARAQRQLYRALARFIGENLVHMEVEESENNAALWSLYGDQEILAIHDQILASLPPEAAMAGLVMIVQASRPSERAQMLGGMARTMPAPAFDAVLEAIRPALSPLDRQKLSLALEQQALAA